ncbi:MAG: FHA domain-containing protein [Candidatus Acidiferrales bacterium]
MDVLLEVITGVGAGQRLAVREGQTLTIGRTNKSDVAIPDDYMSGLHFAVECSAAGCRVLDRQSSNGTFLNESRIHDAMVASGDKIRAGQSTFVVQFAKQAQPWPEMGAAPRYTPPPTPPQPSFNAPQPPTARPYDPPTPAPATPAFAAPAPPAAKPFEATPAPPISSAPRAVAPTAAVFSRPALLTVGSWRFGVIPEGWQPTEGFGLQVAAKEGFPSSVVATEEQLFEGGTLQQFVEAQVTMLRQYLRGPSFEAALPPSIPGADETVALDVRYSTKQGESIFYRRVYARAGGTVGVLTLTTLEKDLPSIKGAFGELLGEVGFTPQRAAGAPR